MKLKLASLLAMLVLVATACTGSPATTSTDAKADGAQDKTEAAAADSGDSDTGELKGDITFQTWSLKNDRFTPYFEKLVADFEKENPGVTVKWMDQPGDGYEDKVLQQALAGQLPDVVNLPPEFAYKLAQVNELQDLSAVKNPILDQYVKGATGAYQYPDIKGTFAYAWYLGTDLNWWNKDMLAKAELGEDKVPTTMDELFDFATKAAENTKGEVKIISESPRTGTLSSAGIPIFKDGKFVFNTKEAAELIDKYTAAYKAGAMPPEALTGDYLGNSMLYKQGKVGWTTASAGFASELKNDAPDLVDKSIVAARIGLSPLFIQGISVSAKSKHPEVAQAFAAYATNTANQIEFLKIAQGFFPGTVEGNKDTTKFVDSEASDLQKKATEIAAKSILTAEPEYPIQFTYDMDKYLRQQVALAVKGDISAQEALDKAVKYANDNLEN